MSAVLLAPSSYSVPSNIQGAWRESALFAGQVWSYPDVPCTSVSVRISEISEHWRAVQDGVNLVVFREKAWCHNERCSRTRVFPSNALAMTTVYPEGARGHRVEEADIEINARGFQGEKAKLAVADLRAILVHEVGHVLGLEDACRASHGVAAPEITQCSPEDRNSVMFAPNRLQRPTEKDILTLCNIYPRSPQTVAATSEGMKQETKVLSPQALP